MADEISPPDDELAALLAVDALPPDEQADAELRFGTFPTGLADVVTALAEATAQEPPAGLRGATLSRAMQRRRAGRPAGGVAACSPAEAFDRTVGEFGAVLTGLNAAEWAMAAHEQHGTVRDLVAHLVGVEQLCRSWLDPSAVPPVDPRVDHVSATRPVVEQLAGVDGPILAQRWLDSARAVAAMAASGDPARPVLFHDLPTTADGLLVIRTFELWAHWMDIAVATGRPIPALDPERMALLSATLMDFLPAAPGYRGSATRGTARFVLLGDAGGCYNVTLGSPHAAAEFDQPDVTIIADTIDLCRVAARRLPPDHLEVTIEGDRELGAAILADLDALARD
jgi:uncharacterized protein (TIGR03083 family)